MARWRTTGNQTQLAVSISTSSHECDDPGDSSIGVRIRWPLPGGEQQRSVPIGRLIHIETGENGWVELSYGDTGEIAKSAEITFENASGSKISGTYTVTLKNGGQQQGSFIGKQCTQPDGELAVRAPADVLPPGSILTLHVYWSSEPVQFALSPRSPVTIRLSPGLYTVVVSGNARGGSCWYREWHKKIRIRSSHTTFVQPKVTRGGSVCEQESKGPTIGKKINFIGTQVIPASVSPRSLGLEQSSYRLCWV